MWWNDFPRPAAERKFSTDVIRRSRNFALFVRQKLTESGSEVLLLWQVPGDIIGLVSLLANPPAYMAGAKTVSECEFLVWDHGTIRRLAKAYPQLKFEVRDRPLRSEAQPEMKIVCASRAWTGD
jgi:hypothetical protein